MTFLKLFLYPVTVMMDLIKIIIVYMPGISGIYLRRFYYSSIFKSCGRGLVVDVGVIIENPTLISVGDHVTIDKYCNISTGKKLIGDVFQRSNKKFLFDSGEIFIGNEVHIASYSIIAGYGGIYIGNKVVLSSGCKLYSLSNLAYDPRDKKKIISLMPYSQANFLLSPIVIEDNVWLGLNTIVMPGVIVNQNSFAVSNSLLISIYPENSYLSGQPAIKIRNRFL